jgi:asparagine synthase (glutamine-hydrolysing)
MDSYLDAIWAATQFLEDPFDSNCTLLSLMFLLAERDGCRVVVSGVDGEHAVGLPTNYVSYLLRQGKWLAAWNEAKGLSQHYWRGHHSPSNLFALALRSRYTPDFVRTLKRRISEPKKYRRLLKTYAINGEFARRTNMGKRLREYETSMRLNPGADLGEWHKHALQVPYLIAGIERYERLASYFAVETRHPLLDIRLLNFTVSLPWTQKARGGWSKILLRRLASQRLPPEVAWREGWEELGWLFLRHQVEQVDVVSNCLEASSRSAVSLYVDREFFRQNSRLYFGEDYSTDWAYVWAQYCLGSWLASVKQGVK